MAISYLDGEIASLIEQPKPLPPDWRNRMRSTRKRGHDERQMDLTGLAGDGFRLILRRSRINPLDFSIVLCLRVPRSDQLFRLRRYDGRSHEHTNQIEGETFYGFHIHTATERYQAISDRMDAFAQPTDRYASFAEALRCLIDDAHLTPPDAWRDALSSRGRP